MSQNANAAHAEGLRIEYLPVTDLKPSERNARKHTDADISAIMASIRQFGFNDPLGIWGGGGHYCRGTRAADRCSEARHD